MGRSTCVYSEFMTNIINIHFTNGFINLKIETNDQHNIFIELNDDLSSDFEQCFD